MMIKRCAFGAAFSGGHSRKMGSILHFEKPNFVQAPFGYTNLKSLMPALYSKDKVSIDRQKQKNEVSNSKNDKLQRIPTFECE